MNVLNNRGGLFQAGALGHGGKSLSDLFRLPAQGAARSSAKEKSVILVWLGGGPGHMETGDPKPEAPDQYRSQLGVKPR